MIYLLNPLHSNWSIGPKQHISNAIISSSTDNQLFLYIYLPGFLFPCGFHYRTCLIKLVLSFLRVCLIQIHFHFFFNLFPDAVLVCPHCELFFFYLVLPFNFEGVFDTFVYKCLSLLVVLVTNATCF